MMEMETTQLARGRPESYRSGGMYDGGQEVPYDLGGKTRVVEGMARSRKCTCFDLEFNDTLRIVHQTLIIRGHLTAYQDKHVFKCTLVLLRDSDKKLRDSVRNPATYLQSIPG